MRFDLTSRALGLPVSEGFCASARAQAMWQESALKPAAPQTRERATGLRGTALRSEQPIVALPVIDGVHNYTNALSAHQVRRLLPTP
ncbi:hypothetical protein [Lentzea sp. HUAS12]|uniref:hypothetical protein n=1 Tax=Lentzea sp. HUAS12 TaxID=2951806 RepID=UPI00209C8631|nr:hypothetical protein [Lentzea sp. HUAS12]USX49022.1 hypothetical protein ND450_26635 [Lentzea sp. HUAS12]